MKHVGKYVLLYSCTVSHYSHSQMFPDFHKKTLKFPNVACVELEFSMIIMIKTSHFL